MALLLAILTMSDNGNHRWARFLGLVVVPPKRQSFNVRSGRKCPNREIGATGEMSERGGQRKSNV